LSVLGNGYFLIALGVTAFGALRRAGIVGGDNDTLSVLIILVGLLALAASLVRIRRDVAHADSAKTEPRPAEDENEDEEVPETRHGTRFLGIEGEGKIRDVRVARNYAESDEFIGISGTPDIEGLEVDENVHKPHKSVLAGQPEQETESAALRLLRRQYQEGKGIEHALTSLSVVMYLPEPEVHFSLWVRTTRDVLDAHMPALARVFSNAKPAFGLLFLSNPKATLAKGCGLKLEVVEMAIERLGGSVANGSRGQAA
jgi:hypothetical protein